jgi:tetratricopeptide (TPR) repeat protein
MPETFKQEIKLFYCYAREDKALRDELEKHLGSLKRLFALRNWHDREILPGEEWEQVIDTHLNTAHLILLLVSPDFMNSDYCYGKEMQRALERHEAGTCRVMPIILRPTYLEAAPFSKLQMLPTGAKPITRWTNRDEAFHNVVKEISLVLKGLLISLKTKKDWFDEAISYRNQQRYDYALEAFEQALRLDPNYMEAYQEKGMTLLELARYDYALEAFEQALRLDPNLVSLYIAKGQTLNALERYKEALTAFEQAIHLDPDYIGRDKALQQLGISREAQEQLASQLQQTQQQLEDQQKRVEQLTSQLAYTHQQRVEALEQLELSQETQKDFENQLQEAQQQLEDQQKQSKQLGSQLVQTQQQKDKAQEQLSLAKEPQDELASQPGKAVAARVGNNIRKVRTKLGLTQAQLAAPEFTVSYISAIERGKKRPSLKALSIIAKRLDVSLTFLLEGSPTGAE